MDTPHEVFVETTTAPTQSGESVDHPTHYNEHPSGVECITIVEELSFNIGNAIKYLWRQGLKPTADAKTDLRKAIWYIEREIARQEKHRDRSE